MRITQQMEEHGQILNKITEAENANGYCDSDSSADSDNDDRLYVSGDIFMKQGVNAVTEGGQKKMIENEKNNSGYSSSDTDNDLYTKVDNVTIQ